MSTNNEIIDEMSKVQEKLQTLLDQEKLSSFELNLQFLQQFYPLVDDFSQIETICEQFNQTDLTNVENKGLFLCQLLQQLKISDVTSRSQKPGPDEIKLKQILDRTGYKLEITAGQRKYGGPPPSGPDRPAHHSEVFIGKLPRDVFEDELIPLCEQVGPIWDLRLMIDPISGYNKGYCFVTYCCQTDSTKACELLNGFAIRPGKMIKANHSVANTRLFIGNIPKTKSKEEIHSELVKAVEGVTDVIVYAPADEVDKKKNRGFCFVDFDTHKNASAAKRKLANGRVRVFNRDIAVDWADPDDEPDDHIMSQVKVLYVRNLTSEVSENDVKDVFLPFGNIERVRKVRDYAFVHFEMRDDALNAMQELNGKILGRNEMEISLAKPLSDKRKQAQVKREQRKHHEPSMVPLRGKRRSDQPTFQTNNNNNTNGRGNHSQRNYRQNRGTGVERNTNMNNQLKTDHEPIQQQQQQHRPETSKPMIYNNPSNYHIAVNHQTLVQPSNGLCMTPNGVSINPMQPNQPYGGYIVFHHTPYGMSPVLAYYAATPAYHYMENKSSFYNSTTNESIPSEQ